MFSTAIMMHPSRMKYKDYLLSQLGDVPVAMDRKNDLWDTARRAWLAYDPKKKFHLVVQDDVILCKNFKKKVKALLKKYRDNYAYCLFIRWKERLLRQGIDIEKELKKGYLIWWKLQYCQATILPIYLIEDMVRYCDKLTDDKFKNRDDDRITEFLKSKKIDTYYPLPSWVQHRGEESSLIGFGHNRGRQAFSFIDDYKK